MLDLLFVGIMVVVLIAVVVILIAIPSPFGDNSADEWDDEPNDEVDNDKKTN